MPWSSMQYIFSRKEVRSVRTYTALELKYLSVAKSRGFECMESHIDFLECV